MARGKGNKETAAGMLLVDGCCFNVDGPDCEEGKIVSEREERERKKRRKNLSDEIHDCFTVNESNKVLVSTFDIHPFERMRLREREERVRDKRER